MEKKNTGLIIIIGLLILLVLSLGGYIVYDKVLLDNDDNITTSTTTTTTTTKPADEGENFIFKETYDYQLNNINHKITYKYYYHDFNDKTCEANSEDCLKYYVSAIVYMNDKKIAGAENNIYYGTEYVNDYNKVEELLKESNLLNKNNLLTLKGADKDYLVLSIYHTLAYIDGSINPQIVNDKGEMLYTAKIMEGTSVYYIDETKSKPYTNADGSHNQFYIKEDKRYYMTFNCFSDTDDGKPYEYTLTVANDKVTRTEVIIPSGEYQGAGAKC